MRSNVPNPNIGRHLGLHPAQFVFGLFDEPQDAHMVAPISGHCYDFAADEDGGFAVEAATVQDPIGFAAGLCDENGPMWGQPLVEAAKKYRRWIGLLNMSNDDNNAQRHARRERQRAVPVGLPAARARADQQRARVLDARCSKAAGATQILWSGLATTHMQGSCRMGADPATSVVDTHGQSHEVKRLYVGDSSLHPADAVGEPVADDHGDRDPSRRLPRLGRRAASSAPAAANSSWREQPYGPVRRSRRPVTRAGRPVRQRVAIRVRDERSRPAIAFMSDRFGLEHCMKLPAAAPRSWPAASPRSATRSSRWDRAAARSSS